MRKTETYMNRATNPTCKKGFDLKSTGSLSSSKMVAVDRSRTSLGSFQWMNTIASAPSCCHVGPSRRSSPTSICAFMSGHILASSANTNMIFRTEAQEKQGENSVVLHGKINTRIWYLPTELWASTKKDVEDDFHCPSRMVACPSPDGGFSAKAITHGVDEAVAGHAPNGSQLQTLCKHSFQRIYDLTLGEKLVCLLSFRRFRCKPWKATGLHSICFL